jgi:ribosomal protein S18 acetylase RimI-like enzyme
MMMKTVEFGVLTAADHAAAVALWNACEGVCSGESAEEFARILARNPGLSPCARVGSELVAAVLCCHDGRRGYLYHLGVAAAQRGRGIASELVSRALAGLRREQIRRCSIHVYVDNESGEAFWRKLGWRVRTDLKILAVDLE